MQIYRLKNKSKGFTILELLITIFILTIVVFGVYEATNSFSAKFTAQEVSKNSNQTADKMTNDIANDFESIVIKDKNQAILESSTTGGVTKIVFCTTNSENHTTCIVMYVVEQQNNGTYSFEKRILENKSALDFQKNLTQSSSFIAEFEYSKYKKIKYEINIKNFSLCLINIDKNNTTSIFDLSQNTCVIKNKIYINEDNETSAKKLDKLAFDISINFFIKNIQNIDVKNLNHIQTIIKHRLSVVKSEFLN